MAKVIRREIRKRGPVGTLIKWAFILFNLVMLAAMAVTCNSTGEVMRNAHSDAEQAGAALGTMAVGGFMISIWMAGVVILGALTLFTRGPAVIVEETVE